MTPDPALETKSHLSTPVCLPTATGAAGGLGQLLAKPER